jgi:hypothetical protein
MQYISIALYSNISWKSTIFTDICLKILFTIKLSSVCDDSCRQLFAAKIRFVGPKIFYTISNEDEMNVTDWYIDKQLQD